MYIFPLAAFSRINETASDKMNMKNKVLSLLISTKIWIRYTLIKLHLLTSQDLYYVPTLWLLIHNGPNQLPKLSTNEATSMRKFTFLRFCCRRFFFHEKSMKIKPAELIWNFSGLFRWSCGDCWLWTSFKTYLKIKDLRIQYENDIKLFKIRARNHAQGSWIYKFSNKVHQFYCLCYIIKVQ